METKDIETKIDEAAVVAKRVTAKLDDTRQEVEDTTESAITSVQASFARATKKGGHRFSETIVKAAHRFQEAATKFANRADEWADKAATRADAAAAHAGRDSRKFVRKMTGK